MKKCFVFIVSSALLITFVWVNSRSIAEDGEEQIINIFNVSKGDFEEVSKITVNKEELRENLTADQFHTTQEKGTEPSFTGKLLKNEKKGVYQCVVCKTDLFISDAKYDSKTGWPSFWQPAAQENIEFKEDNSLFMKRIEVVCPRCGSHLGHVFDDGPPPTNKRYCINSASLHFQSTENK